MTLEATVAGHGADVVLLHGLGATRYSWRHTAAALAGFRTHAPDLAGFGASKAPKGFGYSMAEHAELVIGHLVEAGVSRCDLVGHSLGGGIACYVVDRLRRAPGIPLEVRRLVLVSALVYPEGAGGSADPFAAALAGLQDGALLTAKGRARFLLQAGYRDPSRIGTDQVEAYAANFALMRLGVLSQHRRRFGAIAELEARYPGFDLETLVLWGREDTVLPLGAYGEPFAADLPNATLRVVEDCGHIPQEEQPQPTNAAIVDFLS